MVLMFRDKASGVRPISVSGLWARVQPHRFHQKPLSASNGTLLAIALLFFYRVNRRRKVKITETGRR